MLTKRYHLIYQPLITAPGYECLSIRDCPPGIRFSVASVNEGEVFGSSRLRIFRQKCRAPTGACPRCKRAGCLAHCVANVLNTDKYFISRLLTFNEACWIEDRYICDGIPMQF